PKELVPLSLMRPISGSGALAVIDEILKTHGADTFIGRCASVMAGSTETTFYTLAVYLGSVGITNSIHTVRSALCADLTAMIVSVIIVKLIFY
ncbi:MAG: spore maturation protein, partial [Clostridia bacterium]|nr:spore maturation protein [Clostridia bacterium]